MDRYLNMVECVEEVDIDAMLDSENPETRKIARRIRMARRMDFANPKPPPPRKLTAAELQMEKSMDRIISLIEEGRRPITNIKIANIKKELERRKKQQIFESELSGFIQELLTDTERQFIEINNRWKQTYQEKDPLKIHEGTEIELDESLDYFREKDAVIEDLKTKLKEADLKYHENLMKQNNFINVLIDRLNDQINVLNDCYREELMYLQNVINVEANDLLAKRRKQWDKMADEKETMEMDFVKEQYNELSNYELELDAKHILQHEKTRKVKLDLQSKLHGVLLQLDHVRNTCLVNAEKLNCNFQMLQKRCEENQMIKWQQRRVISRLQGLVGDAKESALSERQRLLHEVNRLTSDLKTLHKNVNDADERISILAAVNNRKYFNLWDCNQKIIEELVQKITIADKKIYGSLLCTQWSVPVQTSWSKESLASYIEGKRTLKYMKGKQGKHRTLPRMKDEEKNHLLRLVMDSIEEKTDFIIDDFVKVLVAPLNKKESMLVTMTSLLAALGVREPQDMESIIKFFLPYIRCEQCELVLNTASGDLDKSKTTLKISSESSLHRASALDAGHSDRQKNVLDTIVEKVGNQFSLTNRVTEEEYISGRMKQPISQLADDEELILREDEVPRQEEIIHRHDILGVKLDQENLPLIVKNGEDLTKRQLKPSGSTSSMQQVNVMTCKNKGHTPAILPSHVSVALKEFVVKFNEDKEVKEFTSLSDIVNRKSHSLCRLLLKEEVNEFWKNYTNIFAEDKKQLWKALLGQLKEYYNILRRRHCLNENIAKLKTSNSELRRFLSRYINWEGLTDEQHAITQRVNELLEKCKDADDSNASFDFDSETFVTDLTTVATEYEE